MELRALKHLGLLFPNNPSPPSLLKNPATITLFYLSPQQVIRLLPSCNKQPQYLLKFDNSQHRSLLG